MYSTWDCWIAELQSEKGKGISPNFAFWDIWKAFDKVLISSLYFKLEKLGISA